MGTQGQQASVSWYGVEAQRGDQPLSRPKAMQGPRPIVLRPQREPPPLPPPPAAAHVPLVTTPSKRHVHGHLNPLDHNSRAALEMMNICAKFRLCFPRQNQSMALHSAPCKDLVNTLPAPFIPINIWLQ